MADDQQTPPNDDEPKASASSGRKGQDTMDHDTKDGEVVQGHDRESRSPSRPEELLPDELLALPLSQRPVFPTMMLPLGVPPGRMAEVIRHAIAHRHNYVGFFLTKEPLDDAATFTPEHLHRSGCVARIMKHADNEDGSIQILCQVLARFRFERVVASEPQVLVSGRVIRPHVDAHDPQIRAAAMAIVSSLKELVSHNPVFADEIRSVLANFNAADGPGRLADLAATLTTAGRDEIQEILACEAVLPRLEQVLVLLAKETQLSALKGKIAKQIEEKVSDHQRKFFLHEQLKAIKQELGIETDDKSLELDRFRKVVDEKGERIPQEARDAIADDIRKLSLLEPNSPEYGVTRSRLEWLTALPWGDYTTDDLDLTHLREGLDKDHHGLEEVKDRIGEFVAVRKLTGDNGGGIVLLAGPPGTGKTSIGASIAKQLGRKYFRLSLGGLRDEAEIKGHRRTYIGALPGKLVQALRRCGSMNPVILLDEVDKLTRGAQGDPAATLLEVLDPEQNRDFLDHYLDVRVDLSRVLFVCTANEEGGIPEPLRDRMEVIRLAGYVEAEKLAIASRHLVPKQRSAHGLSSKDLVFTATGLRGLVRGYAREAGVRRLEQLIAKICRKVATAKASKPKRFTRCSITPTTLHDYVGGPLMRDDELMPHAVPGVVTGLAWTSMGGATLEIEAVATAAGEGKGGLVLTGQLGDVMKESANLARSYLMSISTKLGIDDDWFENHRVHLHVPAGATPKDGPSAGVSMATAMLSLAMGKPVRRKLGMTGELTLTGRVYPIGGVREKLIAAKRSGLRVVLLPKANERDYDELPDHVRDGIDVHFVERLDEVLGHAGLLKP
jgi:ATP-dependent Lon protease